MRSKLFLAVAIAAMVATAATPNRTPVNTSPLGVSASRIDQMKRRYKVLNATTNRTVTASLVTREAQAGYRDKMRKALADLADRETRLDRIKTYAEERKAHYQELHDKALTQTMRAVYDEMINLNNRIIDWCDGKAGE